MKDKTTRDLLQDLDFAIDRLAACIEAAYEEGWNDASVREPQTFKEAWKASQARKDIAAMNKIEQYSYTSDQPVWFDGEPPTPTCAVRTLYTATPSRAALDALLAETHAALALALSAPACKPCVAVPEAVREAAMEYDEFHSVDFEDGWSEESCGKIALIANFARDLALSAPACECAKWKRLSRTCFACDTEFDTIADLKAHVITCEKHPPNVECAKLRSERDAEARFSAIAKAEIIQLRAQLDASEAEKRPWGKPWPLNEREWRVAVMRRVEAIEARKQEDAG